MTSGQLEITSKVHTSRDAFVLRKRQERARMISLYATALVMALVMLACCREINLFCFRSIAKCEDAAASLHASIQNAAHTTKASIVAQRHN